MGALITDGVDAKLVTALKAALEAEGATLEFIAPTVGGVQMSNGQSLKTGHKFSAGHSVLFDAVAILNSADATEDLLKNPAVGDFIRDAFAHLKFIGYTETATPLFEKAGIADELDAACVELNGSKSIGEFMSACRKLRFWEREERLSS
jgi:catalase